MTEEGNVSQYDEDEWEDSVNRPLKMSKGYEEDEEGGMQEDESLGELVEGETMRPRSPPRGGPQSTLPSGNKTGNSQAQPAWRSGTAARLFLAQEDGDWSSSIEKRLKKTIPLDPNDVLGKPCANGSILNIEDMIGAIGTEDWFGQFQVCGGGDGNERVTIQPKEWKEWVRLVREYLVEGHRSIRELACALAITLVLHTDWRTKAGNTGGKGWCGYLALLQAKYANEGYDYDMACYMADEGMPGLEERLMSMLVSLRTAGSGAKIDEVGRSHSN
jgi:hypothetical protein